MCLSVFQVLFKFSSNLDVMLMQQPHGGGEPSLRVRASSE
jgi:hypothetical protein